MDLSADHSEQPKKSGLAIGSLVCGILGMSCLWFFASIPAIICGHQ